MNIDLHTHTVYSYDAEHAALAEHVRAAADNGIDVLGFSEHADFFYRDSLKESDFAPGTVDFAMYKAEVEPFRDGRAIVPDMQAQQADIAACRAAYAGKIQLRAGIELGQPHAAPDLADALLAQYPLDYAIGSVHHSSDDMDLYFLRYEVLHTNDVLDDYFNEMDAMLRYGSFQILGHIDYPLRVMKLPHNRPSLRGYMERVDAVLRRIIQQGIALECNAKGLFGWQQQVGPEDFVLARYRELGGELVTIGSDSHAPQTVGNGIPQALDKLRAAGFRYVTDFKEKKPIQHKL